MIEPGQIAKGIAHELMIKISTDEYDRLRRWKYGARNINKEFSRERQDGKWVPVNAQYRSNAIEASVRKDAVEHVKSIDIQM